MVASRSMSIFLTAQELPQMSRVECGGAVLRYYCFKTLPWYSWYSCELAVSSIATVGRVSSSLDAAAEFSGGLGRLSQTLP